MKNRMSLIGIVVGMLALTAAFEYSRAQTAPAPAAVSTGKIGVVSISGVFNKSQLQAQYRNKVMAKDAENKSAIEALTKAIDAEEAQLKTLKPGTDDYLKQVQSYLQKRSELDYRQEFIKQQRSVEDRQWFEKLYPEILKVVAALAEEKKLDAVLERTEPSLSLARSGDELMTMVGTHKVLYSGGCVDLTEEVVARLDATAKPEN
jgi:Skp family chaperone for outer membrane proteins